MTGLNIADIRASMEGTKEQRGELCLQLFADTPTDHP